MQETTDRESEREYMLDDLNIPYGTQGRTAAATVATAGALHCIIEDAWAAAAAAAAEAFAYSNIYCWPVSMLLNMYPSEWERGTAARALQTACVRTRSGGLPWQRRQLAACTCGEACGSFCTAKECGTSCDANTWGSPTVKTTQSQVNLKSYC